MSVDWNAACFKCKKYVHLGQDFTSGPCFGYGWNDSQGREVAAAFIAKHVYHDIRVKRTDETPEDFVEEISAGDQE